MKRKLMRSCVSAKLISVLILVGIVSILFPTSVAQASEWVSGTDSNPVQIGEGAWHFSIDLGVKPAGVLGFVNSQYDFNAQTNGISVDYDFNGTGDDYSCSGPLFGVAPTLHISGEPGFRNGWDVADLDDGIFSGIVHATAPPVQVSITVESESFISLLPSLEELAERVANLEAANEALENRLEAAEAKLNEEIQPRLDALEAAQVCLQKVLDWLVKYVIPTGLINQAEKKGHPMPECP